MKRKFILIGFLFVIPYLSFTQNDVKDIEKNGINRSAERPRTVLLEGFTSSTCGPCVQGNNNLKSVLAQNQGRYALIKYQMYWPGNGDPYYTAEGGTRRSLYGVNSVPWIWINGTQNLVTTSFTNYILTNWQNIPANMELDVDFYVSGKTVYAKAIIDPTIDFKGQNLKLYMAIVEKKTYNNSQTIPNQSNGEKEFDQVMKKFMPDANGILIGNLNADDHVVILQEWEFKGNYRLPNNASNPINNNIEHSVEDFNNLTIVAWVQAQDKSVEQACNGINTTGPTLSFSNSNGGMIEAMVNGNPIPSGQQLNIGDEITFTATPDEGFEIKNWKIDGVVIQEKVSNELTVTFEGQYLDVMVNYHSTHLNVDYSVVNGNGTINATVDDEEIKPGVLILRGSQVIFTANPVESYKVKQWKNNGTVITGNTTNEYIISSIDNDVNVTVEFENKYVYVNYSVVFDEFGALSATVNDEIIESGTPVEKGSTVVFTALPDEAYRVKQWKINGNNITGNTTNQYVITSLSIEANVTVEFEYKYLNVSFSVVNNEFGTVTATVNEETVESGDLVEKGSTIVFTAIPDKCYKVKEWENNGTVVTGNTSTQYIISSLTDEVNITVKFVYNCVNVNFSVVNNEFGTLTVTANEEPIESGDPVDKGSRIVFTANPDQCCKIIEWKNNGTPITGYVSTQYVITSISLEANITVEFENNCVNVNFSAINEEFGALTATVKEEPIESGNMTELGSKVIFTAEPVDQYEVKEWKLNGDIVPENITNEFIIESLTGEVDVTVEFIMLSGINSSSLSKIIIYPNPFTNSISITNAENVRTVVITNILGQTIKELKSTSKNVIEIDTKDFPSGIYLVNLQALNGDMSVVRVVK